MILGWKYVVSDVEKEMYRERGSGRVPSKIEDETAYNWPASILSFRIGSVRLKLASITPKLFCCSGRRWLIEMGAPGLSPKHLRLNSRNLLLSGLSQKHLRLDQRWARGMGCSLDWTWRTFCWTVGDTEAQYNLTYEIPVLLKSILKHGDLHWWDACVNSENLAGWVNDTCVLIHRLLYACR